MNSLTLQIPLDLVPEKYLTEYYQAIKSNACLILCLFSAMDFAVDLYNLVKMLISGGASHPGVPFFLEVVLVIDASLFIGSTVAYCTFAKYKCYFGGVIAILGFIVTIPPTEALFARPELFGDTHLL